LGSGTLMFVEVRCVLFRLLCRVEEGSDQLGYVALRYGSPLEASRGEVFWDLLCSVTAVQQGLGFLGSVRIS